MFHFAHDDHGILRAEGVDLRTIATEVGTPSYVYTRATIERHFRVFRDAFSAHPSVVCYAMKANPSRAILALLARMGAGADIVSAGELERALAAGIPASKIVFSGVGKTADEMRRALGAGIRTFNVESEPELVALDEVAGAMGKVAPVSLRVNPNVDAKTHPYIATGLSAAKFGIPIAEAPGIAERLRARRNVSLVGLDCHIGSQLTTIDPILEALDSVLGLSDSLRAAGHPIHDIDMGGGLGIPYGNEAPPPPAVLGAAVTERMKGRSESLVLEPGRVIVGNAGLLLTRVLYIKRTPTKTFVIVDAAMNDLLRPALYGAHHEIWPVVRQEGAASMTADVVGPVCETTDAFAKARVLPEFAAGDLVAIMSAGAYGASMSSTYNSRPLVAEVMVDGDRWSVVRKRQTIEALMADEVLPPWIT
jgi:diaminopimelate decarboxylase